MILIPVIAYWMLTDPKLTGPQAWIALARQVLVMLTIVGSGTYIVRLLQHAGRSSTPMKEFRLKRLDLDIDRASWLVELALEWQGEKETEIPAEMLDRLGRNLFADRDHHEPDSHPLETALSSIFAHAASMSLDVGPMKAAFDRKSLKGIEKEAAKEEKEKEKA